MGNKAEAFRREIIGSGDPLRRHSLNQDTAKDVRERIERGRDRKKEKSQDRKLRQGKLLHDLPAMQFSRAVGHVLEERATSQDLDYNIDNFGHVSDEFTTETGEKAIVTIVDFTRSPS